MKFTPIAADVELTNGTHLTGWRAWLYMSPFLILFSPILIALGVVYGIVMALAVLAALVAGAADRGIDWWLDRREMRRFRRQVESWSEDGS